MQLAFNKLDPWLVDAVLCVAAGLNLESEGKKGSRA
jgi:hypothetical protein